MPKPHEGPIDSPRYPRDLIEFIRGADLLIADGQYTDEEYRDQVNWGHSRATTLVDLAAAADVKRVAVFHDPMQADADVERKVDACKARAARLGASLDIFGAREGIEIKRSTPERGGQREGHHERHPGSSSPGT